MFIALLVHESCNVSSESCNVCSNTSYLKGFGFLRFALFFFYCWSLPGASAAVRPICPDILPASGHNLSEKVYMSTYNIMTNLMAFTLWIQTLITSILLEYLVSFDINNTYTGV